MGYPYPNFCLRAFWGPIIGLWEFGVGLQVFRLMGLGRFGAWIGGLLGFGVPYFNTFFVKRNHYEINVYTFFSLVT